MTPIHGTWHVVCHTCDFEAIVEGDQADAAFERDDHQQQLDGHDVELGCIDGADVHSFVYGQADQTVLLSDSETRDKALASGRWVETRDPINATDRR